MDRHGAAVRAGRTELAESQLAHAGITPAINLDVSVEKVYVSGDEARGNNPTPDQDIVDDVGKAIEIEYQDDEELGASDKVVERDKHRRKLDPASSEDYKDRK